MGVAGGQCPVVLRREGRRRAQARGQALLADEWHRLGGLGHLLGHKEEEDSLGQEHVDGDGTLLTTRCP